MTTIRFILLFTLLLVLSVPALYAELPKDIADDYWMGIHYGNSRIGYLHTVIKHDTFEGKQVIAKQDDLVLRIKSNGETSDMKLKQTLYVGEGFMPIAVLFEASSPDADDQNVKAEMRYNKDSVDMTMTVPQEDAEPVKLSNPLDNKEMAELAAGVKYDLGLTKLEVGDKLKVALSAMDALNISSENVQFGVGSAHVDLEVLREEMLSYYTKSVRTLAVKEKQSEDTSTRWYSTTGQLYKIHQDKNNVTFLREPMKDAMDIGEGLSKQKVKAEASESATSVTDSATNTVVEPRDKPDLAQDYWMGVYCEGTRIGYLHVAVKPDTYEGKKVIAKQEEFRVRVKHGPKLDDETMRHTLYVGDDLKPVAEIVSVKDKDKPYTDIQIRYTPDSTELEMSKDNEKPTKMRYPADDSKEAAAGVIYDLGIAKLDVHGKFAIRHMNVSQINLGDEALTWSYNAEDSNVEVMRKETVEGAGPMLVVIENNGKSLVTKWFDESGQLYKQSSDKSNISFIREPKERALSIEKGEPPVVGK